MDARTESILNYRGYEIKPDKQYPSMLVVVTAGKGGKIPNVLSGLFTSKGLAKQLIDQYLTGKNNAEAIK